ncbi:MAG: peptide chain release factor N(5)-glutamine methyltransferase [Kiritimatiellae bacterium]|nr:peptide chain release factor N(5)-glutamine methyltransferase [Kiritimatiellia bacterium]
MTICDILRGAVEQLAVAGVASAQVAAEWTLAYVLGCRRFDLTVDSARVPTGEQLEHFHLLCARLAAHEPLQYVLGTTDFMGLTLQTDARALIPRPETEQLVERVLASVCLPDGGSGSGVDVGTGSGCIVLALAGRCPGWRWVAVDREEGALSLARENARALGLEGAVSWRRGDLLDGFEAGAMDLVVSNPPYINTGVCETLAPEVRDHEPRAALDGGADGLDVVRRLVEQAARVLRPGGWIFLEIGHDQGHRVSRLLSEAGFFGVCIHPDWAGHDRIAEGKKA